ncbi:AraC family transcriptional regulator [Vreelandella venusta]|uniref:AraC family transcriptional regulator n=1 Tax=Vreelandella venusta TaxID=44935 RepID=UPI003AA84E0B
MSTDHPPNTHLAKWENAKNPVVSMFKEYPAGHHIPPHQHQRGQLIYASTGTMRLCTRDEYWLLPPFRGVWMPPYVEHEMSASTPVCLRTLYVNVESFTLNLPSHPVGIGVTALLRELLIRASCFSITYHPDSFEERLLRLALEEMKLAFECGLKLPMGRDKRLKKICDTLLENPGDVRSLADWANEVGATTRTLSRLFRTETGISFIQWREQVRIVSAMSELSTGQRVSQVAEHLGYASQGAFTVMFKRVTGKSPREYLNDLSCSQTKLSRMEE